VDDKHLHYGCDRQPQLEAVQARIYRLVFILFAARWQSEVRSGGQSLTVAHDRAKPEKEKPEDAAYYSNAQADKAEQLGLF
jgi:hypothetical protein